MKTVLIVDDEYEKVQALRAVLEEASADFRIEHATSASAARVLLGKGAVDMMLVDLHLPDAVGSAPTSDGGLRLFDMIKLDSRVELPAEVVFVTGKEDLLDGASSEVRRRGSTLIQYSASSGEWREAIRGRAEFLLARLNRTQKMCADVAIVTALRTPELSAVLELDYGWRTFRVPHDPISYQEGSIEVAGRPIRIVAASAQRKGMPSSAVLAARMALIFRPKLLVMLGICAGRRDKVNLGDIVVADPAWDWGSGKQVLDGHGSRVFQMSPYQSPLSPDMAMRVVELSHDQEVTKRIASAWTQKVPAGRLAVRVGPMASGASVLADSEAVGEIALQNRDLLAIDMEAYAVMAAAEYVSRGEMTAVVIKSVCDFGDAKKDDDWQPYAAFTSARFFDELIRTGAVI